MLIQTYRSLLFALLLVGLSAALGYWMTGAQDTTPRSSQRVDTEEHTEMLERDLQRIIASLGAYQHWGAAPSLESAEVLAKSGVDPSVGFQLLGIQQVAGEQEALFLFKGKSTSDLFVRANPDGIIRLREGTSVAQDLTLQLISERHVEFAFQGNIIKRYLYDYGKPAADK